MRSPAPNTVFQLRVDFLPTIHDGGELEFIEFSATRPPLAEDVVGEIYPPEVELGEVVQFTYAIAPTIRAPHAGFDQIAISAPFGLVGVDTVKISDVPVAAIIEIERPDSTLFSVRLVRAIRQELPESGHFSLSWDARNGGGKLVSPGLYVYRLAVEAENGDDQQSGTIAVVY